jgi:hypothetical protein
VKVYIHLPNGDYNDHVILNGDNEVSWELNEGCQKFVLVTKEKIDDDKILPLIKAIEDILK